MVPRAWTERVLRDLNQESIWNEMMREKGYYPAQLTVQPLHKRIRRVIRGLVFDAREAVAVKIAPWLEQEE